VEWEDLDRATCQATPKPPFAPHEPRERAPRRKGPFLRPTIDTNEQRPVLAHSLRPASATDEDVPYQAVPRSAESWGAKAWRGATVAEHKS